MHYDFIAIPDAEVAKAVEPIFQHVVTTYASEANKTVSMWRAIPDNMLDFKPRRRTRSARSWFTNFSPSGAFSLSSLAPKSRPSNNSCLPVKSPSFRHISTSMSGS